MKKIRKIIIIAYVTTSAMAVFAANTTDLRVIGKIVPTACTPSFVSGNIIGNITTSSLSVVSETKLAIKSVPYTITCGTPVKIAFSVVDNRFATVPAGMRQSYRFGLGSDGAGYYTIKNSAGNAITGDGKAVDSILSYDNGITWTKARSDTYIHTQEKPQLSSVAEPGTLTPTPYATITGYLDLQATIIPLNQMDLTKATTVDGLATLELKYL
jgi:hypothetical protein